MSQQITLYHGSNRADMTIAAVDIVRQHGQKQGKPGRVYGGFYLTACPQRAARYAAMAEGTPTVYAVKLSSGQAIELPEITRIPAARIADIVAAGHSVATGIDPRGHREFVVLDTSIITSMERHQ